MQAVSDEQLIRWVTQGDKSCLGTLFERHHSGVYRFCMQLTRSPQASEDLVQDVFIKVLNNCHGYRGEGSFKAWMYHIARNLAFDHLRSARRHRVREQNCADGDDHEENRSPERQAIDGETVGLLEQALARLPKGAREVIWLGRFQLPNYEDLGCALGCSPGAARVRMHRAMQQLQLLYAQLDGGLING